MNLSNDLLPELLGLWQKQASVKLKIKDIGCEKELPSD